MKNLKNYLSENSKIIFKIIINHFGAAVFGFILSIVTLRASSFVFYIAGAFSIIFYWFLLYVSLWEKGAEDKTRIDGGRLERNNLSGLFYSLIAYIPIFVFIIILFIASPFVTPDEVTAGGNFYGIIKIILNYMNAMYLSIYTAFNGVFTNPILYPICYVITTLASCLVCTLSYISGVSGQRCLIPERTSKNTKQ